MPHAPSRSIHPLISSCPAANAAATATGSVTAIRVPAPAPTRPATFLPEAPLARACQAILSFARPGNPRFAQETTPIVDNQELGNPPPYRERHLDAARRAMPAGVADRLLRDAEERELDLRRQSLLRADALWSRPTPPSPTGVAWPPARSERRRAHAPRADAAATRSSAPAHRRVHRAPGPRGEQLLACRRRRAVERADRQVDSEQRRRQRLRRAIVEVARQRRRSSSRALAGPSEDGRSSTAGFMRLPAAIADRTPPDQKRPPPHGVWSGGSMPRSIRIPGCTYSPLLVSRRAAC